MSIHTKDIKINQRQLAEAFNRPIHNNMINALLPWELRTFIYVLKSIQYFIVSGELS